MHLKINFAVQIGLSRFHLMKVRKVRTSQSSLLPNWKASIQLMTASAAESKLPHWKQWGKGERVG